MHILPRIGLVTLNQVSNKKYPKYIKNIFKDFVSDYGFFFHSWFLIFFFMVFLVYFFTYSLTIFLITLEEKIEIRDRGEQIYLAPLWGFPLVLIMHIYALYITSVDLLWVLLLLFMVLLTILSVLTHFSVINKTSLKQINVILFHITDLYYLHFLVW